ncbi:LLM class flavin-dependent oxidoreductase [Bacillus sp. BGMRC 2118]|nr:LLM class flavin-dependent oxidoreductase [Bacillus sp. BGMRC 2118]
MTNKMLNDIPFSILDLSPIVAGSNARESLLNTINLAQHAEKWGYNRYWLAEHHNMPGIASSATAVVIGQVAANTTKIRVGSGGVMLPNHASLVVAEQFGTLESLYPNRIDLGLGRAPGTDYRTMIALRRDPRKTGDDFPEQLTELRNYFNPSIGSENSQVHAIPGEGLSIPIWLLGSSGFCAQLAGQLGLPFSFASHFSPANTIPALQLYKSSFTPSEELQEPYVMVGVNVIAADTDEEAQKLATSMYQQFLSLVRNKPGQLQPPVDNMDELWSEQEKAALEQQLGSSIIGSPETVKKRLQLFLHETNADEIIINSQIYDHEARLHSFKLVSAICNL